MICVEGYKAFEGVLRVTPKSKITEPFELKGQFLYNPFSRCWYGCGRSFVADICEVVSDVGHRSDV